MKIDSVQEYITEIIHAEGLDNLYFQPAIQEAMHGAEITEELAGKIAFLLRMPDPQIFIDVDRAHKAYKKYTIKKHMKKIKSLDKV